ncbi:MAG: EI24 domain-containing protein [Candidatus Accumulibacter sp.]|jgi:CysZ protein|nr:EI24 domain-containing protein [Candidatus Accumulibacter propinquus]
MTDVGLALLRSIKTLGQGRVWLLVFGPAVLGLLVWVGLAVFSLEWLIASLVEQPPLSWLAGWGVLWLAKLAAALGGWLLILAAAFVTAMLLAAIFVMPLLLEVVSSTDYPELARLGKDSLAGAVVNSLVAVLVFTVGWLLTLPLWLIPGLALLLPVLWMAWLTRRTFAYDALAVHATVDEWRLLRRQHGFPMLLLGVILALLAHIPVIGLLTPTLAALAYTHYCLEALRRLRQGAVVTVIGQQPILKELR